MPLIRPDASSVSIILPQEYAIVNIQSLLADRFHPLLPRLLSCRARKRKPCD